MVTGEGEFQEFGWDEDENKELSPSGCGEPEPGGRLTTTFTRP